MGKKDNCKTCASPLARTTIEELEGTAGDWKALMLSFPVLACPMGHERKELYGDFHVEWSEDLAYERKELWVKPRGLLRWSRGCPNCDAKIPGDAPTSATTVRTGLLREQPETFEVEITGPMALCPNCRTPLIRNEDSAPMFDALTDALDNAKIKRY
jgi:hypothetical protein